MYTLGPLPVCQGRAARSRPLLFKSVKHAKHIGICLEYGTYPLERVITALRADHWAHRYDSRMTAQGLAQQVISKAAHLLP